MKAICIIGSPQSNGSTATIVDKIIEGNFWTLNPSTTAQKVA